MKAEIKKDGHIWLIAETPTEAYALKYLFLPNDAEDICHECGRSRQNRLVLDESVLMAAGD